MSWQLVLILLCFCYELVAAYIMTLHSSKTRSIVAATFCFCLLFSSAAYAYVMYTHSMFSHGGLVQEVGNETGEAAMQQHSHSGGQTGGQEKMMSDNSTSHDSASHDCCDNGEVPCSSSSAICAAHCAVSVTDVDQCLFQYSPSSNFGTEFKLSNPALVSLAGPFKPPRN